MQYGMATYEGGAGFLLPQDQLFHVLTFSSVPAVRNVGLNSLLSSPHIPSYLGQKLPRAGQSQE